jgi:hypothetical protein
MDRLSSELRHDIDALIGAGLNREHVDELAARIEAELPELVVAVRNVQRPFGEVRVIFLVARISENRDLASNINARYTVESVTISGIDGCRWRVCRLFVVATGREPGVL